jgi:hypothetical protein
VGAVGRELGKEGEEVFTIDKIQYHVDPQVFVSICQLRDMGDVVRLKLWLKDCNDEITRRKEAKENTYPLFYEKAFLEHVLGTEKPQLAHRG